MTSSFSRSRRPKYMAKELTVRRPRVAPPEPEDDSFVMLMGEDDVASGDDLVESGGSV